MTCAALDNGSPCPHEPVMTEPVRLCGTHQVQVALATFPGLLRDSLTKFASPVAVEKLLWNGAHRSVVYFVRNGGRVKIGFTTNLKGRIISLSLRTDDVLLTLSGGSDLESALHERFAEHRVGNTEWFRISPSIRQYIAERRKSAGLSATPYPRKSRAPRRPVEAIPEGEKKRALSDIRSVLGDAERVRTPEVLHRLKNANPEKYSDWDGGRLRRALTDAGEDTGKSSGYPVVNRVRVEKALLRFSKTNEGAR